MRRLRWSLALAVQAGAHRVLLPTHPGEHDLSPSQRAAFIAISFGLVVAAGLMSGLTLGLMSMDLVELEVLKRSGTAVEQTYAAAIYPIVSNQHFLLVTLLLCNACAMEALPLFLDRLADPVSAILISVTAVLVFGEVLPQAVCSRYGLAIGYYCAWLVRLLMAATSPISWPIGKLLDFLLGAEHRALFRRGQLKALVDIHGADEGLGGNLTEDEIKVICGALDLTSKTARKSMTPLNKVFMLPADARLNQATMRAILASGHSRIPVYTRGDRSSIIGLILVKELLQYKTHQEVPVSDVRMRSLPRLPADTPMYDMLKLFQTGRSHMVVLTDTPATARAALEAAAKAAAAAEAAAAVEAASDSSSRSSDSPLTGMLGGRRRKNKRLQFESPLLQPIETPEETSPQQLEAQQQQPQQQQNGTHGAATSVAALLEGPFANGQQQRGQDVIIGSSIIQPRSLARNSSSGRSKGRVGCHELGDGTAVSEASPLLAQTPASGGISDSSSSLAQLQLQLQLPHQQQQQQEQHQEDRAPAAAGVTARRSSSGGSSHGSGLRTRSKSGPVLLSLATGQEGGLYADIINGPEGVTVPIGIITIEDVIEELMQAEIVDETDLFVDNERSITVNAAALAQGLPDQLRLALQSPQHQAVVAGVAGALVGAGGLAGGARGSGAAANVRKLLVRQRSSSTLGPPVVSAAGLALVGSGGSGSSSHHQGEILVVSSPLAAAAAGTAAAPIGAFGRVTAGALLSGGPAAPREGSSSSSGGAHGGGNSSSSGAPGTGVVAAVSAGLAAAAAAVGGSKGVSSSGTEGRGSSTERLPLLSSAEQAAAGHNHTR